MPLLRPLTLLPTQRSRTAAAAFIGALLLFGVFVPATSGAQRPRPAPPKPAPAKAAPAPAVDTTKKAAPPAPLQPMGSVAGIVIDSAHAGPLRRAAVSLEGTTLITFTNEAGKFRLDSVPPGSYRVRVDHDLLHFLVRERKGLRDHLDP